LAKLAVARDFLEEYVKLDKTVRRKVAAAFGKFAAGAFAGLSLEKVALAKDGRIRTFRVDENWRAVVLAVEPGDTYCLVAVLPHDDAYAFATSRRFGVNAALGLFEVWNEEALDLMEPELREMVEEATDCLFAGFSDRQLTELGVEPGLLPLLGLLTTQAQLDALEPHIPPAQYAALYLLAGGLSVEETWAEVAECYPAAAAPPQPGRTDLAVAIAHTPGEVAFIAGRDDLEEVLAEPETAWRLLVTPGQQDIPMAPHASGPTMTGIAEEFIDNDSGYLDWIATHHGGFVLNIGRSKRGYARVHRADCGSITSRAPFSGPYIKICSESLAVLDQWALRHSGAAAPRCGICQPLPADPHTLPPPVARLPVRPAPAAPLSGSARGQSWQIHGPASDDRQVRLCTDRYIPFDNLSPAQHEARDELRRRARSLMASTGEILHASYAGPKPVNADVENLALYNIDATASGCFKEAARYGVRFEMATGRRHEPSNSESYACTYRYQFIHPDSDLAHWRATQTLAQFANADLGSFPGAKRLEQVWLAVQRAPVVRLHGELSAPAPFAVLLTISSPAGRATSANPELVKALIDGVTAAFQGHGQQADLNELATRLAANLGEQRDDIAELLAGRRNAVLGIMPRLLCLRGGGVQWMPGDNMCMAGQVQCSVGTGSGWRLSGEIVALEGLI
jgi:hypothetical protein